MKIDFGRAVEVLDIYIQKKTSHSTKAIVGAMMTICSMDFVSQVDQNDFANACANFDKYVQETGKTSIGRKQFEEWWDIQGTGEAGNWSPEALAEIDDDGTDWTPCEKVHKDIYECPYCEIDRLKQQLADIQGLIQRGL